MQGEEQRQREVAELTTRSYVIDCDHIFSWNCIGFPTHCHSGRSRTWCHTNLSPGSFCPRTSGPEMCTVGMSSLKMFEDVWRCLKGSCFFFFFFLTLCHCISALHFQRMTACQVAAQVKTHVWDTSVRDPPATYFRLFLGEVNAYMQKLEEEERQKMTEEEDYAQSFWSLVTHCQTNQCKSDNAKLRTSETIKTYRNLHVLHHGHVRPCFGCLHVSRTCIRAWCSIWQRLVLFWFPERM